MPPRAHPSATASAGSTGHGGPQSVGRVVLLLEHLVAHREGATLAELAQATRAPKTSLVGLLQALVHERCVRRDKTGRYALGERIVELALHTNSGRELTAHAHPYLQALVNATGETAILGVVDATADLAVYVDKVEGSHPLRYTVNVGERREMHCTAMGKALLAHCDDDRIKRVLTPKQLQRFTSSTITSPKLLERELAHIREEGIARSINQRIDGVAACAAPVFGAGQQFLGALLVAGPIDRYLAQQALIEGEVKGQAAALSRALGANPVKSEPSRRSRAHGKL